MTKKPHTMLIEASLSGHHSIYLERTALAFIDADQTVTIALPVDLKGPAGLIKSLNDNPSIKFVWYEPSFNLSGSGIFGLFKREYGVWTVFNTIYKQVQADMPLDYVFLPYVDYCLYAIGLLGSPFGAVKYGGICMRPSFHHKESGVVAPSSKIDTVKRYLFLRLLQSQYLATLFTIDELLPLFVKLHAPKLINRLRYLPDPADEPIAVDACMVRAEFFTPNEAKVVLVYGALDERKGVFHLLDALEASTELNEWHVWLIGRQSTKVKELLLSGRWDKLKSSARVYARDAFVSIDIEQKAFGVCDAVWVGYEAHFGMSGVLVHAGLNRKPVIACVEGLIGWYTTQRGLGLVVEKSQASIEGALLKLADAHAAAKLGQAGFEQFRLNTWVNFSTKIRQGSDSLL